MICLVYGFMGMQILVLFYAEIPLAMTRDRKSEDTPDARTNLSYGNQIEKHVC